MKILTKIFIAIQTILWDLNLSRKAKQTDLKQLTQLQLPLWQMNRSVKEVTMVLCGVYSWLEKEEKCLILSIVTASALINFSKIEECEIIIAVKPFSFAAHAWVEVDGEIIPPSEGLSDYKEIIRIRFNEIGQTVVAQQPNHI